MDFDCEATAALYPFRGCYMWCQCCGCTNFKRARQENFPPKLAVALSDLCIDPFEPGYTTRSRKGSIPPGYVRYTGRYWLIGSLDGACRTSRVQTEKDCWLWIVPADKRGHSDDPNPYGLCGGRKSVSPQAAKSWLTSLTTYCALHLNPFRSTTTPCSQAQNRYFPATPCPPSTDSFDSTKGWSTRSCHPLPGLLSTELSAAA